MLTLIVRNRRDHGFGQCLRARSALRPVSGHHRPAAEAGDLGFNEFQFRRGIGGEVIDAHHSGQAVLRGDVLIVPLKVDQTAFEGAEVLQVQSIQCGTAVILQGPSSGDQDGRAGLEARFAAFDVNEFLGTEVGAEARLGDHEVSELQRGARR